MVHQSVAKTPSDITPWSWADSLIPMMVTWDNERGRERLTQMCLQRYCPVRNVRINKQMRPGITGVETTERFRAISEVLSRPIGDFQASRFFEFPAMLDTEAMAQIVEAVRSATGAQRNEAVYLRCILLSEIIATGDTVKLLTHVATRVAVDSSVSKIERHVGIYGGNAPNGTIAAVDLSHFAALMTRKATYLGGRSFSHDSKFIGAVSAAS
ncbi:hypothetical protein MRX96_017579 [Rhipicephalus microplus]